MQYDLVFEGGGAKGMVFVGALDEFTQRGHTPGRLLGTSAGAITATLLAAGYTVAEMQAALAEQTNNAPVFATFMGQPAPLPLETLENGSLGKVFNEIDFPLLPASFEKKLDRAILKWLDATAIGQHLLSFTERGGWYSAEAFLAWIAKKLDSGSLNGKPRAFSRMTLAEFYTATGKDLSLVAANVSKELKLVLNHRTAPNVPVIWATRMSMSIPFLWQEVIWQAEWDPYRGNQLLAGDTIVDGGLLSNFPIELFISDQPLVQQVMGPKIDEHVLGLLIDDSLPVPNAPLRPDAKGQTAKKGGISIGSLETVRRTMNIINTMLEANDKAVIAAYENRVVRLPAASYGTTEFDMTEARRQALVAGGRQAMQRYFEQLATKAVSFDVETEPTAQEMADQIALRMLR
jgi:NTE family protein